MKLPGIGDLEPDDDFGWWVCPPIHVPLLDGAVSFVVDDEPSAHPAEYAAAILSFMALDHRALEAVSDEAFAYYRDIVRLLSHQPGLWEVPDIDGPDVVWQHIRLGDEPHVGWDDATQAAYVSLESECDWEPEHGIQLVFRDGRQVTKLGQFDGHLTNAAAYGDAGLLDVIYHRIGPAAG